MRTRSFVFGLALCALPLSGCGTILGLDSFRDAEGSGGSGGGDTSTTTSATTTTTEGSGGNAGGGGSGAGGMMCMPGDVTSCYDGTPGTAGTGPCKSGLSTCAADGQSWGPCKGQVIDAPAEDCATPADDDCDGLNGPDENCCTPGGSVECYSGPTGTDGVGLCKGVMVQCPATGIPPEGPCPGEVLPQTEFCAAVADEDCNGFNCYIDVFTAGTNDIEYGVGLAIDPVFHHVAVAGGYGAFLTIGMDNLPGVAGSSAYFVSAFDEHANPLWAKGFGADTGQEALFDADSDALGNIVVGGQYGFAPFDPGGGMLPAPVGAEAFIATYGWNGAFLSSRVIAGSGHSQVLALEPTFEGLLVAGNFTGTIDVGDPGTPVLLTAQGGFDVFVVLYDTDGKHVWSRAIGGGQDEDQVTMEAAQGGDNDLLLTFATSSSAIAVGGGNTITNANSVVMRLDGSAGSTVWAKAIEGNASAPIGGFGPSAPMYVAMSLGAAGPTTYGGADSYSASTMFGQDLLLLQLDYNTGMPVWAKQWAAEEGIGPGALHVTSQELTFSAGYGAGAFTFEGIALPDESLPQGGAFVATFTHGGSLKWIHTMGTSASRITEDEDGDAWLTGAFGKLTDFGGGSVPNSQYSDFYLLKLGK